MELSTVPNDDWSYGVHDEYASTFRHIDATKNQNELLSKECVVCGMEESKWDHYQLPCLHYGHTRCVRHWIYTKQSFQCPLCRDSTPVSKYCKKCVKWTNHIIDDCSKMNYDIDFRRYDHSKFLQNIEKIRHSEYHDKEKKSWMISFMIRHQLTNIDTIETLEDFYNSIVYPKAIKSKKKPRQNK